MKLIWQIGVILGICLAGEGLSLLLPVPFPASVISMILLFLLLYGKLLKPDQIHKCSDFLTKNMAFLFIPSGVGVMRIFGSVQNSVLRLLAVCMITTVLTFAVTALTVRGAIRFQQRAVLKKGKGK